MIGPALSFIAIAIIISAIVSLIGTSSRRRAVEEGRASIAELCELTGILHPGALQDVLGPPTLDGQYHHISMADVKRARTKLALLISEDRLDLACIGVAVLAFFWHPPLLELILMMAAAYQTAGWFLSVKLPGQR